MRLDGRVTPICPHWSLTQDLIAPIPHQSWIDYDLELVARCDAVLRIDGDSVGADIEVEYAKSHGIPVLYRLVDLYEWADSFCGKD